MKENNIETSTNDNLDPIQNESEILDLTGGNATFFNFVANNDSGNKTDCEKIDNAKKTLDSIYHVYKQVNELDKDNKLKANSENNQIVDDSTGRIVMPGTDYHGDRRSFQAGVISELVTWKKDVISVMDVIDGEILFTGTIDQIKANISEIKNKLHDKNMDHQAKIKPKIRQIITQGMTAYLQKNLSPSSCNCEAIQDATQNKTFKITITESDNKKIFKDQNTKSIVIEFDLNTVVNILVDIETDDEQKSEKLKNYFNQLKSYKALTYESQATILYFFMQFFCISKQRKVALVHDFEINENFDPEKQSVVLLGDDIDRGDGSCEILCMISNILNRISESDDKRFKNNKDCFVAISENHESGHLSKKDETNSVCNAKNSCYANDLAKKMMADGQLVSGHITASETNDTFFSFSHAYIIKTDCYLIMQQIFQLEDLFQNINNEN